MTRNTRKSLMMAVRFFNDPPVSPPPPPPPPASPPPPPPPPPAGQQQAPADMEIPPQFSGMTSFTQQQMNEIFAHNRRKLQQTHQRTIEQLETLRQQANLTQQQRDALTTEIEQIRAQTQTKEQQAQQAYNQLQKKYNDDTKTLKETGEAWQRRFETTITSNEILTAASTHKAFNPQQIEAILLPLTKVVEEVQKGQPTGKFVPQVSFTTKDKDGKPVQLTLTVDEAVKTMTEMPDQYGNLFRNDANGGLGGNPAPGQAGNGKPVDIDDVSLDDYRKNRKAILADLSKQQRESQRS